MTCKICRQPAQSQFKAQVLGKYTVEYFACPHCGFLQTEDPYWLEEAYQSAINISDTGIVSRNISLRNSVTPLLLTLFGRNRQFLDFAGGYGLFIRLMRDAGFDFYWEDPYCENLFARGFEVQSGQKFAALTAFEVFEHLANPWTDIDRMLKSSRNIIFSTLLLPDPIPEPDLWWYYCFHHGQHIAFYQPRTLAYIAQQKGLHFTTNGKNLHLFSERPVSPLAFQALTRVGTFSYPILKQFLSSKTWSDHELMREKDYAN